MDATWVVDTLKQAVKQHGAPKYINSDQGSQFTSDEYTEYVKSLKETEISMYRKGRATDNAHIERFFRTLTSKS
jgi:putative transposase